MKTVFFFCLSSLGLILAQTLPPPKPNHTPFTTNCKLTNRGLEYAGPTNVTKSGYTCQRWDSQQPNKHGYTASHPFPERNLSDAGNKCRNPNNHPEGVWCYTTDPKKVWEHCDVNFCDVGCKQTQAGLEYTGSQRVTTSGLMCQRWDSDVTNTNSYKVSGIYSDGSVSAAGNKCRNPNKSGNGVWCYTTDKITTWEHCDLEFCAQTKERRPYFTPLTTDCKLTKVGLEYAGPVNVTNSGYPCQRWDSNQPTNHPYTDPNLYPEGSLSDAGNKCRNPSSELDGVWCYTTDPKKGWEYCDVKFCDVGCKQAAAGLEYTGSQRVTTSGRICQRWDSDEPHANKYKDPKLYPDGSLSAAGNKCRNPNKRSDGVWCYTTDPAIELELCDVEICDLTSTTHPSLGSENSTRVGCKLTKAGREYTGSLKVTRTGKPCQPWNSDRPHTNKFKDPKLYPDGSLASAGNKCRNPDKNYDEGVWCYTNDTRTEREPCDVEFCDVGCKPTKAGRDYTGPQSETASGQICQRWDSDDPHVNKYKDSKLYPDGNATAAGNKCRNPDADYNEGVWCYTTNPDIERELCDVAYCSSP